MLKLGKVESAHNSHSGLTKKRILLVEDETIIALGESKQLQKAGYEVILAYSGEEAVKIFERGKRVDLVLMDINLGPGIDGTETARRILDICEVPIVFLSCYIDAETVLKAEGITSYGYVVKDSGEAVLLASLRLAFRLWDSHQNVDYATQIFHTLASSETTPNKQVFQQSVQNLAALLGCKYAFASLVDEKDPTRANAVDVWKGDGYGEPFSYSLAGAPCWDVLTTGDCFIEEKVQELYPENSLLAELGIQSYWGTVLTSEDGGCKGVLAACDTNPMKVNPWSKDILHIIANRIMAGIYRLNPSP